MNEIEQVNGGVVALAWAVYGAYQAYPIVRTVSQGFAVGVTLGALKAGNGVQ